MQDMNIRFNGNNYTAKYNEQSKYYEIDLEAPLEGGIYQAEANFIDLFGESYENIKAVQVLSKEKIKIKTGKVFMWIFDYKDFSVKDIIEISDYEIIIDEETNAVTTISVLKNTTAKSKDIVAVKKDSDVIYWGVVDNIQNEDGSLLNQFTAKYITNIFDEKIALVQNSEELEIAEGYYRIKSALSTNKVLEVANGSLENQAKIQIWENNKTDAQKWKIKKEEDGYYRIQNRKSNKCFEVPGADYTSGNIIQQYTPNDGGAQKWTITYDSNAKYRISTYVNDLSVDVSNASVENATKIQIYSNNNTQAQRFILERLDEEIIKDVGIEDYIAKVINDNFINSKDTLMNRNYLEVRVKTHTRLQATVTNVQDNLYNLHTWMTNCTQLYNINYNFFIEDKKLIIEIENKAIKKELIDTTVQAISNYTEVFETDVVSKVEVITDTSIYCLYLLNDRTTSTDINNENRADGRTERVYTAQLEDAEQKALDVIQANKYNHMITFSMFEKKMSVGTPIAIKTKKSLIYDTYVSAIKITPSNFYEYTLRKYKN